MAEAVITLKLSPAEFKLIQSALQVAKLESEIAAKNAENPRNKQASRAEAVLFGTLLERLS